jgi:hypothetical protein
MCDCHPARYFFGECLPYMASSIQSAALPSHVISKASSSTLSLWLKTDCGSNQPKPRTREISHCGARHFLIWTSGLTSRLYMDVAESMCIELVYLCMAGHFSIRTLGVRPARLREVKLNSLCSAHVVRQVYQAPTSESAVLSVVLLMAHNGNLLEASLIT